MSDGLHGPQGHLTGPGRGRFHPGVPAVGSGLLLHNAEIGRNRSRFREIPAPFPVLQQILFIVSVQAVGKIRIGIIGDEIQAFLCHPVVVQIAEQAVGGDEIIRLFVFPYDSGLQSGEAAGTVGNEAQVVQNPVRICRIADGGLRHIHLTPRGIGLVPEHRAPGLIERLDGAVFFFQKFPEGNRITVGIKFRSLAIQLIVNLPADYRGTGTVVGRGFFRDIRRKTLIDRRIVIVMPSCPVPVKGSVHLRVQHLRIFLHQPCGRRCRRRTEDDLHGRFFHHIQEGVKKFIGVLPLPRLDLVPGKFRDTDDADSRLQHPVQILLPKAPVPMLRIIAGTERQIVSIDDFSHDLLLPL